MTDVNKELSAFDANEAAEVANAQQNGFTAAELDTAQQVIANERKFVEAGIETAEDAEDNVANTITSTLFDDPEAEDDQYQL